MANLAVKFTHDNDIKETSSVDDNHNYVYPMDEDLMAGVVEDENGDTSSSDDYDDMDRFKPVIDALDLEQLPHFAVSIRTRNVHADTPTGTNTPDSTMTCEVLYPPLTGSYHILYRLEFNDGVRWIFKVPITGYQAQFDKRAAQALTSEALTMRLLQRETTIPVPKVYSFDASLDNAVKCPFIMMECMEGRPLHELWFQPWSCEAQLEEFRKRILQQLAAAVVQLSAFTYDQGGSLVFDKAGNVAGIGPARVVDLAAQFERLCNHAEEEDEHPLFYTKGPIKDPKSFLSFIWERGPPRPRKFNHGMHLLLRMFIDWMPYDQSSGESPYILAHPDFALQNVLVSGDGTLRGIIDWDGAAAVPRCFGHYPLWLMNDWEPVSYNWNFATSKLQDEDGLPEDSPEKLKYYRKMYAQFVEQEAEAFSNADHGQECTKSSIKPKVFSDLVTPKALLFRTLTLAIEDPMFSSQNISFIFDKIERLTAADWDDDYSEPDSEGAITHQTECHTKNECIPSVSVNTEEKPCRAISEELIDRRNNSNYCQQDDILRPEMGTTGRGGDDKLDDSKLQPVAVRSDSGLGAKLFAHRIQDSFQHASKVLPKNKGKLFANATAPLLVMAGASSNGIARPQIRNAFHTHGGILHRTNVRHDGKDREPQPAIVQPALAEAHSSSSVESHPGRLQKVILPTGLLRKQKVEDSGKDGKFAPGLNEASMHPNVKLRGGRVRSVFQHAVELLQMKKVSDSSEGITSQPAVADTCKRDNAKPRRNRFQRILRRTFPCLRKGKVNSKEAQASITPAHTEDDLVWNQFCHELEQTGISATMVREHQSSLIATVKQALESKVMDENGLQAVPEVPQPSDVAQELGEDETEVVSQAPQPSDIAQEIEENEIEVVPELPQPSDVAGETEEDKMTARIKEITEKQAYDPSMFSLWDISIALKDNTLPQEAVVRLKEGFAALIASIS